MHEPELERVIDIYMQNRQCKVKGTNSRRKFLMKASSRGASQVLKQFSIGSFACTCHKRTTSPKAFALFGRISTKTHPSIHPITSLPRVVRYESPPMNGENRPLVTHEPVEFENNRWKFEAYSRLG